MKRLLCWCTTVIWLCVTLPALAADKPVMTWMVMDWQPVFNLVDGKPTDGIADAIIKDMVREWPEVDHQILVVTQARGMANLAAGYPACFPSLRITPEREKTAYFSPSEIAAPVQVVVRADRVDKLPKNDKGEVMPAELFDRSDLIGILEPGRSFSPLVDTLLGKRGPQSGIRMVHATDSGATALIMLSLDRGDYTLEYDYLLAYQQKRHPELTRGVGLRSFPLVGATVSQVGIACPRTEWGRNMVIKIDALTSKLAKRPEFREAILRWQTPDGIRIGQKARDAFYRERIKPSDPGKYGPAPPDNKQAPGTATTP